jgi:catechol 2,3-dioxygenase-like lactoylglutathione lyase family enzyme
MIRTYGLTHISMMVRDAECAYQFYRAVFGVEEYWREPGQIQAKTPGAHDVLVFNEGAKSAGKSGGIDHIGFRLVDPADIDVAVEAVERAGGRVLSRGDFEKGEPYAFVTDPDGYKVEIWYE